MKLPVKTRHVSFNVFGQRINSNDGQWGQFEYSARDLESALKFANEFNARADYRGMVAQALVHLEGIPITTEAEVLALTRAQWYLDIKPSFGDYDRMREKADELERDLATARKRYDEMKEDRDSYRIMFDQLQIDRAKMLSKIQDQLDTLNNIIEEDEDRD